MSLPALDAQSQLFSTAALTNVVFAKILEGLMEAGLVERRTRQRLDSTQMLGLVAGMSRLENVRGTVRLAIKELELTALAFAKPSWWTEIHVGYKVQVAESVNVEPLAKGEPTRSFLTGIVTHPASASDEAGAELMQQDQAKMGLDKPTELYVDGAYVSAKQLAQAQAEGREIIGPAQRGIVKDNRYGVEQFEVRVEERKAICPAGHENTQCSRLEEEVTGKVTYRYEWSTHCGDCPLKGQCVGAGQKHRTLLVGEYHSHLQQRRKEQKTEEFRKKSQRRNAVEGTQSELVRAHGLRQARYRGLEKARLQNYFAGAACNAKRWIKRMIWEMKSTRASVEPALMSG